MATEVELFEYQDIASRPSIRGFIDTAGNAQISCGGTLVSLGSSSVALPPVTLTADTTLTRAAHYNRLIVADTTAGNITLTATGSDALVGDWVSIDVIGGNSVTLAGVTGQSGYTLTAITGGTVEAKCDVAGVLIAATPVTSIVVESLSAGRLLAATDDKKQFTCTTALTITIPNGLTPPPSAIAIPPTTGNLTIARSGTATLNGSASSITRTFANNRGGVLITPNPYVADDYTVGGS